MIERIPLREQILEKILEMLREGEYQAGDILPSEAQLAQTLGVGRNSVREAMKALALANIVEPLPGKGTFLRKNAGDIPLTQGGVLVLDGIKTISPEELSEVRTFFEIEAAGLAAERGKQNPQALEAFGKSYRELKKNLEANSLYDASVAGYQFHNVLAELTGNKLMVKMLKTIWSENMHFRQLVLLKGDEKEELRIHTRIYNAVMAGDKEEAREAMREHMKNTSELYKAI